MLNPSASIHRSTLNQCVRVNESKAYIRSSSPLLLRHIFVIARRASPLLRPLLAVRHLLPLAACLSSFLCPSPSPKIALLIGPSTLISSHPSPPFSLPVGAQLCLVASSILSQRFSKRIGRVNRVTLHCFSSLQLFFARRHAFVLLVAHVSSPSSCSSCVNSSPSALLAVRRLLVLLVAPHRRLVLPRCSPSLPSPLCPSPFMYLLLRLSLCLYVPLCPLCASLLSVPLCPLLPLYVPLCLVPL